MTFKLLKEEELPENVQERLNSLPKINIYRNIALTYPKAFIPFHDLASTFYTEDSKVSPKLREICILRIAQNTKSEYEKHHHTTLAKNCGVTDNECKIIFSDQKVTELDIEGNMVCKVADELCTNFKLSSETFEKFYSLFKTEKAAEIASCLSFYILTACLLSAYKVEIEDINPLLNLKKPT